MNELDLRLIEVMIELNKFHMRKIEDYNETGQANMTAEDYAILDGALDIIITTKRFDLLIGYFGACSAYKSNWLHEAFAICKDLMTQAQQDTVKEFINGTQI